MRLTVGLISVAAALMLAVAAVAHAEEKSFWSRMNPFGDDPLHEDFDGLYINSLPAEDFATIAAESKEWAQNAVGVRRAEIGNFLVDAPRTTRYLNEILDRIEAAWPHPSPDIRVVVTASMYYEAAAQPDGTISISIQAINLAEDEDELAFLLAHEFAHHALGHLGLDDTFERYTEMAYAIKDIAMIAGAISQNYSGNTAQNQASTKKKKKKTEIQKIALQAEGYYDGMVDVFTDILKPHYKSGQEDQADYLGLDLAVAAGYSERGFAGVLDKLQEAHDARKTNALDMFRNFDRFLAENVTAEDVQSMFGGEGDGIDGLFDSLKDEVMKVGREWLLERLIDIYKVPKDRKDNLRVYVKREYMGGNAQTRDADLNRLRSSGEFKAKYAVAKAAHEAKKARQDGDMTLAEQLARDSVSHGQTSFSLGRLQFSAVRAAQGNEALALKNLEIGARYEFPPDELFTKFAVGLVNDKKFSTAERVLVQGGKALRDDSYLLPYLVFTQQMAGDKKKRDAYYKACKDTNNDYRIDMCRVGFAGLEPDRTDPVARKARNQVAKLCDGQADFLSELGSVFGRLGSSTPAVPIDC